MKTLLLVPGRGDLTVSELFLNMTVFYLLWWNNGCEVVFIAKPQKSFLFCHLLHFLNIIYHMTFPLGEHLEPKHFTVPWFIRVYDFRVGATIGNQDHSSWLETVFSPRWAPRDVCVYICVSAIVVQNETKPQSSH